MQRIAYLFVIYKAKHPLKAKAFKLDNDAKTMEDSFEETFDKFLALISHISQLSIEFYKRYFDPLARQSPPFDILFSMFSKMLTPLSPARYIVKITAILETWN